MDLSAPPPTRQARRAMRLDENRGRWGQDIEEEEDNGRQCVEYYSHGDRSEHFHAESGMRQNQR